MFYAACMDMGWTIAIERNRVPLLRIVATLFAAIGLVEGGVIERLPWSLYRAVLSILKPAESAVRRLIVIVARNLVAKPPPLRPGPKGRKRSGTGKGRAVFRLIDPRKRFNWVVDPSPTGDRPEPCGDGALKRPLFPQPALAPDGTVSAVSLCRRLAAIKGALEDLAAQARRYARWRARPIEERRPRVYSAMRPGRAPGWRKKATHEVDDILTECHEMAYYLPEPRPNTS